MFGSRKRIRVTAFVCALSLVISGAAYGRADAKSKVGLNRKNITITQGKSKTIKLSGVKKKVKWSVSDKKKISLSLSGKYKEKCKLKAKKTGKAKVTAKYEGRKYICTVTVSKTKGRDSGKGASAAPQASAGQGSSVQPVVSPGSTSQSEASPSTQPVAGPEPSPQTSVTIEQLIAANRPAELIKKYGSISAEVRQKTPVGSKGYSKYIESDLYFLESDESREVAFDDHTYVYGIQNGEYDVIIYPDGGRMNYVTENFALSETGTMNETVISCTRKGNDIVLVTGQDEKKLSEVMGNTSESVRESYGYREGDKEESVFVLEADTFLLRKLTTTLYHSDGTSDYSLNYVLSYDDKRPADVDKIVSQNIEGNDTAKVTLVINPGAEDEKKKTVSVVNDAYYYVEDSDNYNIWFEDKEMKHVSAARDYMDNGDVTLYTDM